MKTTTSSKNERLVSGMMIESLENRAMMSVSPVGAGGTSLAASPQPGTTSLLLPAVQKVREAAAQPNGIIAILIGL